MRAVPAICRACVGLFFVAAMPLVGFGQGDDPAENIGGPLMGPLVLDAPFEADAITTARMTLGDGTRLNQSTTARYYRDRAGHVRVELLMEGLPAPHTVAERHIRTIVNTTKNPYNPRTHPERGWTFTLDPVTRTARYMSRDLAGELTGGPGAIGVPLGGVEFLTYMRAGDELAWDAKKGIVVNGVATDESLGDREIEDLDTIGRRITLTVPPRSNSEKAAEMIDERWESPDLKVLISAHCSDTRWGEIDYRLTNIQRVEPPEELFVVPSDYTIQYLGPPDEPSLSLGPPGSYTVAHPLSSRRWERAHQ